MGFMAWMAILLVALVAGVLLVVFPGLWLFALIGFAVVLVAAILMLIARGAGEVGDQTPDVIERRREHEQRRKAR